jgi:Cdc6-like AAA superfamily ATPase
MPGTGKTATTLEVIKYLKNVKKLNFDYIHINGMSLTNPNLVYTILCDAITGRKMNPTSAALFLDEFFKKKNKAEILLNH